MAAGGRRSAEHFRPPQQTEVDRLLVRVYGAVITQSDVRQARALKLVSDTGSDEATQRGLENRLLLLRELAGAAPGQAPSEDAFAARRRMWEQAMGGDAGAQLSRYGMNEASINAWLRDDARIDAFLRQQFGDPGAAGARQGPQQLGRSPTPARGPEMS